MNENSNIPVCELEEKTFQFAKNVRIWVKSLPKTIANVEDIKKLIRAYGSGRTNYFEIYESLSK
jgi:hypothetical protein